MAYTTLASVEGRKAWDDALTTSSTPTKSQAEAIIDGFAADIDGRISAHGHTTPVTSPSTAVNWLAELNAVGAVAAILKARYPNQGGPGSEQSWSFWEKRARDGLRLLTQQSFVDGLLSGGTALRPESYLTRNPDEHEDLGDIAEPVFTMGMDL